jgi:hypothetical protein
MTSRFAKAVACMDHSLQHSVNYQIYVSEFTIVALGLKSLNKFEPKPANTDTIVVI